jgi:hypothetical protein
MNSRIVRPLVMIAMIVAPAVMFIESVELTAEEVYKKPPKEILDVLNAPAIPTASKCG